MPDAASLVGQIVDELEPGTFVTKFVLLAEVINGDGHRGVWMQASDDASAWDTIGMLQYALNREAAAQTLDALDEGV